MGQTFVILTLNNNILRLKVKKEGRQNQNLIKRIWDIQTFEYVVKSNYDIKKLKKWCNEVKVLDVKSKKKLVKNWSTTEIKWD